MTPEVAEIVVGILAELGVKQIYIQTDPPLNVGKLIEYYSAPTGVKPDDINA